MTAPVLLSRRRCWKRSLTGPRSAVQRHRPVPVTDTVKRAMNGIVEETVDRDTLFAVQTPQVFEASLIKAALQRAVEEGVTLTDDCAAVERLGMTVALTRGDRANIKLTTPTDLDLGLGILNGRGEFV